MSASPYSVAMAMVWFTLASLIGCFILRRAEKWGLALVGMIFLLTALRIFVPLDITGSIIIRSQVVYPALQNGLRYSIAGRISVGDCLLLLWMIGTVVQLLRLARDLSRQRKLRNEAELQEGNEWLDSLFLAIAKGRIPWSLSLSRCGERGIRLSGRIPLSLHSSSGGNRHILR